MPNPSDREIHDVLTKYKKIAVVGISPQPHRASHGVSRYLIEQGYDVVGVRPGADTILGRPCYASLSEVPGPLEIVDVFRASDAIPELVDELIALKPKVLWLQEGVTHDVAETKVREAGITVVSDLCILKEHIRLL